MTQYCFRFNYLSGSIAVLSGFEQFKTTIESYLNMNLDQLSLKGEIVCMNDSDWGQTHVAKYNDKYLNVCIYLRSKHWVPQISRYFQINQKQINYDRN